VVRNDDRNEGVGKGLVDLGGVVRSTGEPIEGASGLAIAKP